MVKFDDRREIVARITADPGDGTLAPNISHVLARGFEAMGWQRPQNAAEDMIDAIHNSVQAYAAIPDGYALVPLKPTKSMLESGTGNNPTEWNDGTDPGFMIDVANDVYVAMVLAALDRSE